MQRTMEAVLRFAHHRFVEFLKNLSATARAYLADYFDISNSPRARELYEDYYEIDA